MKDKPFFSIVIPTKNRPNYLEESIKSVLLQSFTDYELIISDNCNDNDTPQIIERYSSLPNVTAIKPDTELNMIDHWEFATSQAVGKFVVLLADRKVLYVDALNKIHTALRAHPNISIASFGVKVFDDQQKQMGWDAPLTKTKVYTTDELLKNFLGENYYSPKTKDFYFPKTLNGCYKNEFVQKLRANGSRYFNNDGVTTPDYSSFFINMSFFDNALYIGEKILLTQGEHTSNGRHFGAGKFEGYMKSLGLADPYTDVPVKAPFIYNLLMVDFLAIQSRFAGNLTSQQPVWENYYYTNYWEYILKAKLQIDGVDLQFFRSAWINAYKEDAQRLDFNLDTNEIEEAYNDNLKIGKLDKVVNFKQHLRDFCFHRFPNNKLMNKMFKHKFNSALLAAGYKIDQIESIGK